MRWLLAATAVLIACKSATSGPARPLDEDAEVRTDGEPRSSQPDAGDEASRDAALQPDSSAAPDSDVGMVPDDARVTRIDAGRVPRDGGAFGGRPQLTQRRHLFNHVHWLGSGPPPCYLDNAVACPARLFTAGVAVRDFDDDGFLDLYITRMDEPDLLLRNRGNGSFEDQREARGIDTVYLTNGAAWGDIDNDGDADLVVGTVGEERLHLFVQDDSGAFSEEANSRGVALEDGVEHTSMSFCFGDTNLDGLLDLATTEWRADVGPVVGSHNRLLQSRASRPGFFTDVTSSAGLSFDNIGRNGSFGFSVQLSDLDADGAPDLAFVSDFGSSRLFWNNGNGTFVDGTSAASVGTEENGMGSVIGDYDNDGLMDWFVTSIRAPMPCPVVGCEWGITGNRLYRNTGGRRFEDQTTATGVRDGGWGWGAAFVDLDHDGDLDIVQANGMEYATMSSPFGSVPLRIWRNDGGRYTEASREMGVVDTEMGRGVAPFDYDNDGDLDLLITNLQGPPSFYENNLTEGRSWIVVRPRGTTSNADAVGAVVRLWATAESEPQIRHAGNGCGFLAHTPATPHFGLNTVERVHRIEVDFPLTGRRVELWDVPARQVLDVVEPDA